MSSERADSGGQKVPEIAPVQPTTNHSVALHPTPLLADLASRSKSRQLGLIPGNGDKVGYWLTPPEVYGPLQEEFGFTYDACPFPRPPGFDGLVEDWGSPAWVNPPWEPGSAGPTAWTRKCIAEAKKGKDVVMIFPQDKWVLELINAGAEVRPLPTFRWLNPKGERQPKAPGRGHALFILRGHGGPRCGSAHRGIECQKGRDHGGRHTAVPGFNYSGGSGAIYWD